MPLTVFLYTGTGSKHVLHGTSRINKQGHLEIGGVDTVELASNFGTPLYVYDVALIRQRARGFKETFEKHGVKAQVAYASKAFRQLQWSKSFMKKVFR